MLKAERKLLKGLTGEIVTWWEILTVPNGASGFVTRQSRNATTAANLIAAKILVRATPLQRAEYALAYNRHTERIINRLKNQTEIRNWGLVSKLADILENRNLKGLELFQVDRTKIS